MSARTDILNAIKNAAFPVDYESISITTGLPAASVRRTTRELQIDGLVRVHSFGNGTATDRKTWVPVGPPATSFQAANS